MSPVWKYTQRAMASDFEIILCGVESKYASEAARAAFLEIYAVEKHLSRFIQDSDVSRFNSLRPGERMRVSHYTAECLSIARQLWLHTSGAFDPAAGALLRWRSRNPSIGTPPQTIISQSGMDKLLSNQNHTEVSVAVEGLSLDLGGIGKGYGVDCAARILREVWDIPSGMVQGGDSSSLVWGSGPHDGGWPLGVRHPSDSNRVIENYIMNDIAASGSGQLLHGNHVIDPRTGQAVSPGHGAWSLASGAAEADGLSTAFMILEAEEVGEVVRDVQDWGALLIDSSGRLLPLGRWKAQSGTGIRIDHQQ